MIKKIMIAAILVLLGACADYEKVGVAHSNEETFDIICIDGVEYLIKGKNYRGFMSPHFKPDGSLYTCLKR